MWVCTCDNLVYGAMKVVVKKGCGCGDCGGLEYSKIEMVEKKNTERRENNAMKQLSSYCRTDWLGVW